MTGEEDCLSLNIFNKHTGSSDLKPVMFWIHGGAFIFGAGSHYDPSPLLKEDVLVVTVNYRLGPLGFLTMGNDLAPGNLGLRDQILALEWVKTLIHYYGGDPNRVTIFGESAGGWSVSQQVVRIKSFHFFNPRKKILAQKICTISNNHFQRCSFSRSCSSLQSIDYR